MQCGGEWVQRILDQKGLTGKLVCESRWVGAAGSLVCSDGSVVCGIAGVREELGGGALTPGRMLP